MDYARAIPLEGRAAGPLIGFVDEALPGLIAVRGAGHCAVIRLAMLTLVVSKPAD